MSKRRHQAKKNEGEDEEEKKIREAARRMFASLFLGGWNLDSASSTGGAPAGEEEARQRSAGAQEGPGAAAAVGHRQQPQPQPAHPGADPSTLRGADSSHLGESTSSAPTSSSPSPSADDSLGGLGRQVAEQVRNLIPEDRQKLRQTSLYKEAYKGIQWQRDNYLVGREYANWRIKERYRLDHGTRSIQSYVDEIQFDEAAMAHPQLARLAAAFIPSDAVKTALLPLIVPVVGNHLYPLAQQGLVHLIESQRDNLNHLLKGQILQFLSNPENRLSIKNSTRGYISTSSASYGE